MTLGPKAFSTLSDGPTTFETVSGFANRVALIAVEEERERLELVGWIQQIGTKLAFFDGDVDPRTIHDNGKSCYPVYRIREGR